MEGKKEIPEEGEESRESGEEGVEALEKAEPAGHEAAAVSEGPQGDGKEREGDPGESEGVGGRPVMHGSPNPYRTFMIRSFGLSLRKRANTSRFIRLSALTCASSRTNSSSLSRLTGISGILNSNLGGAGIWQTVTLKGRWRRCSAAWTV